MPVKLHAREVAPPDLVVRLARSHPYIVNQPSARHSPFEISATVPPFDRGRGRAKILAFRAHEWLADGQFPPTIRLGTFAVCGVIATEICHLLVATDQGLSGQE